MLARQVPGVVQVPQFGALVARIPGAKLVAQGHHALLGAGLLLVAARAAKHHVVAAVGDRLEQWHGLERIAGAVGALAQAAVVDVVLDLGDGEPQPKRSTVASRNAITSSKL